MVSTLSAIFVFLIISELWTAAAAARFVPCPVPALKNGRAKIQMKGRSVKFKCFRPYTLIGKKKFDVITNRFYEQNYGLTNIFSPMA